MAPAAGHGLIDEGLARGARVHGGFDNDAGGATLWAHVKEAYPHAGAIGHDAPAGRAKDWNDALRQQIRQQERQDERTEERVRDQSHEHDRGHGRQEDRGRGRERDDTPSH